MNTSFVGVVSLHFEMETPAIAPFPTAGSKELRRDGKGECRVQPTPKAKKGSFINPNGHNFFFFSSSSFFPILFSILNRLLGTV